jgi:O-antigen ligase
LVSLLFTQIFVERFGAWTSLKAMLWGNALLCAVVSVCAVFAPDLVWISTELDPNPSRLRGDVIAQTGVVSVLAMILLLTTVRKIGKVPSLLLLASFLGLLVLSLMRTAYLTTGVFFVLVVLRRPNIKPLRRFAYFLCLALLLMYVSGRGPSLSHYRDPKTVSDLGDRIGLWHHLSRVTLDQSPWLGMGYYSASRIHGPEYNPGLGTAHSMFIEVLSGGGVLSFALLIALCVILFRYAAALLFAKGNRLSFATCSLLFACLLFGSMGEEIDSGPVAVGFWYCVAVLPQLYEQYVSRRVPVESYKSLPMSISAVSDPKV